MTQTPTNLPEYDSAFGGVNCGAVVADMAVQFLGHEHLPADPSRFEDPKVYAAMLAANPALGVALREAAQDSYPFESLDYEQTLLHIGESVLERLDKDEVQLFDDHVLEIAGYSRTGEQL